MATAVTELVTRWQEAIVPCNRISHRKCVPLPVTFYFLGRFSRRTTAAAMFSINSASSPGGIEARV